MQKKLLFQSPILHLVKTAVAGEDPNWGRIVMGIGKSGEIVDAKKLKNKNWKFYSCREWKNF